MGFVKARSSSPNFPGVNIIGGVTRVAATTIEYLLCATDYGVIGIVQVHDKVVQVAQEPLAKAMYRTMSVGEGISSETMDSSSVIDHCMYIVARATNI